jgi:peptidoglycan-associated lipoprotein
MAKLVLAGVFAVFAAGCPPNYPACNNDEDCNRDQQRNEHCVNQKCQQCRDDKDCKEGQSCNQGRCEAIPNFCKDDSACGDGVCKNNRCTTCADDGQCGEGGKCRAGKCIRKGQCQTDDDCPEGQDCKGGVCTLPPGAQLHGSHAAECNLQPVYFDFNESGLTTESTQAIDANAACMGKVGRAVVLVGRSDPRGTEEYNMALSERRAQSVKDRLLRLGVDGGKLRTLPKGELEATGRDEAGWAQDRRVDFEWM